MKGEHILRHQARGIHSRIDRLLTAYFYACIAFFVLAVVLSLVLLFLGSTTAAVSLVVLSTAITGYAYSALLQRQQHIKDITDKTIGALRGRGDELRKDPDLLLLFTSTTGVNEVDSVKRLKLRLYVSTVLDMYVLILHYINHGYFPHIERFAEIYEEMIKSFFRYSHTRDVWHSKDSWGAGCLKNEYGANLVDMVERVIEEIKTEQCE